MGIRLGAGLAFFSVVLLLESPAAHARPEFARREQKACGFCHINPQGGGPRNQRGLGYARAEFRFPPRAGNLNDLDNKKQRADFILARKLIDLDHVRAAKRILERLHKALKKQPNAQKMVGDELHELNVRSGEILGQARRLVRKNELEEAVALYAILAEEYRDFAVHKDARADLKEISRDKDNRALVKREQNEARARLALLDALASAAAGKKTVSQKELAKVVKRYPGTRAAKSAQAKLPKEATAPPSK